MYRYPTCYSSLSMVALKMYFRILHACMPSYSYGYGLGKVEPRVVSLTSFHFKDTDASKCQSLSHERSRSYLDIIGYWYWIIGQVVWDPWLKGLRKFSADQVTLPLMALRTLARNHQLDCFRKDDANWNEPFFFVQGADLQMGMIDSYFLKKENPGCDQEIELGNKAVAMVNQMQPKPKFFVICGDLCDAMPDEQPEMRQRQIADFKLIFEKLDPDIPLICLSGNHDIGNCPTAKTIDLYKATFGDDYFAFWCGGVRFLVLNSQFFKDATKVPDLAAKHEKWLNEELDKLQKTNSRGIVFQHIPWFLKDPDEDNNYFSVDKNIREGWLQRFKQAGVVHVFAGHTHRNAGGVYKGMPVTVTTAIGGQIGNDQPGLRIVKVLEKEVQQEFFTLDTLPSQVQL